MTDTTKQFLDADTLNNMDAETLLNMDIGELKDLEAFKALPSGLYAFQVLQPEIDTVGADNKAAIKGKFKLLDCLELDNEADRSEFGDDGVFEARDYMELFILEKNKGYGARKFATMFREPAAEAGAKTIVEVLEAAQGLTGAVYIKKSSYSVKDENGKVVETKYSNEMVANTVQWS